MHCHEDRSTGNNTYNREKVEQERGKKILAGKIVQSQIRQILFEEVAFENKF